MLIFKQIINFFKKTSKPHAKFKLNTINRHKQPASQQSHEKTTQILDEKFRQAMQDEANGSLDLPHNYGYDRYVMPTIRKQQEYNKEKIQDENQKKHEDERTRQRK